DLTVVGGQRFFTADDGIHGRELWSVPVTAAPQAQNDQATVAENSGASAIDVLANDSGTGLTVTAVTQGAHGAVQIDANGGGLTYAPAANFSGGDQFSYTVQDSFGRTASATVTVTVQASSNGSAT